MNFLNFFLRGWWLVGEGVCGLVEYKYTSSALTQRSSKLESRISIDLRIQSYSTCLYRPSLPWYFDTKPHRTQILIFPTHTDFFFSSFLLSPFLARLFLGKILRWGRFDNKGPAKGPPRIGFHRKDGSASHNLKELHIDIKEEASACATVAKGGCNLPMTGRHWAEETMMDPASSQI